MLSKNLYFFLISFLLLSAIYTQEKDNEMHIKKPEINSNLEGNRHFQIPEISVQKIKPTTLKDTETIKDIKTIKIKKSKNAEIIYHFNISIDDTLKKKKEWKELSPYVQESTEEEATLRVPKDKYNFVLSLLSKLLDKSTTTED